jgi:hypothetical protein
MEQRFFGFIPTKIHAAADYMVGLIVIGLPSSSNFKGRAGGSS